MSRLSLVLPDSSRGFVRLADGRLFDLPVRAAAARAGRRRLPLELPTGPGELLAAGSVRRRTWLASREAGALRLTLLGGDGSLVREESRPAPALTSSAELGTLHALGGGEEGWPLLLASGGSAWLLRREPDAEPEPLGSGILALAPTRKGAVEWLAAAERLQREAGVEGALERRPLAAPIRHALSGCAPRGTEGALFACRAADGPWQMPDGPVELEDGDRPLGTVASPVRGGVPGLAVRRGERGLWFVAPDGTIRRTEVGLRPEREAVSPTAPWLLECRGGRVELRELGARWGRRLARWDLASD